MNKALDFLTSHIGTEITKSPSPFGNWLGGTIISAEAGEVVREFIVRSDMLNPLGTLHGGVTAAMMDDVLGMTVYSLNQPNVQVTVNLNVDYFLPARAGDVLRVKGEVVRDGRRLINAFVNVYNEDERLVARGTSNLMKSEMPVR
ncbi:PaaI family thioesterase [Roseivirga sp. BDSF3-8]|uniref:PaaI family thioesterase n=1 Tax=Roseivirga sp. BDSF3-8 TaxID=3241598 RepID=UPI0035320616